MNEQPSLVTSCSFKGKQYLVKMNLIRGNSLELSVVDKYSAEEWRCNYDSTFIENLTHKTGNYKQFDIFITMLKSGLLRTSECVTLDLLTFEDLEHLRSRRTVRNGSRINSPQSARGGNSAVTSTNRRYLILTYTVEFDRIHYPLPMEYVGPPNPQVLQATIRRLEAEVLRLQMKLNNKRENNDIELWVRRIKELEAENWILKEEVAHLRQLLTKQTGMGDGVAPCGRASNNIPLALQSLEEQVKRERASFKATLQGLQEQNHRLRREVEELRGKEMLSNKAYPDKILQEHGGRSPTPCHDGHISTRKLDTFTPESPNALSMKQRHRGKKWKETLRNGNSEGMVPKSSFGQGFQAPHIDKCFKGHRSCSSSGDSSSCSRNRSPSKFKLQTQRGRTNLTRWTANESQKIYPKGHNHVRTLSSSSGGSNRNKRGQERCYGRKSRTNSTCSASSSSGASSISGSHHSFKAKGQNTSNAFNRNARRTLNRSYFMSDNTQNQRPRCKLTPGKPPRKLPNKETRTAISDLETRIKALQKLLREGISFP